MLAASAEEEFDGLERRIGGDIDDCDLIVYFRKPWVGGHQGHTQGRKRESRPAFK